jgi:hypothetical protein
MWRIILTEKDKNRIQAVEMRRLGSTMGVQDKTDQLRKQSEKIYR